MSQQVRSQTQYLNAKMTTASQAELHLMLLDGALRFGRKARQAWGDSMDWMEAERYLGRLLDIVEAMVQGVSASTDEIAERLEEQYAFLFREIAACGINNDLKRFDRAMKLLAYERETWNMVCAKQVDEADSEKLTSRESSQTRVPLPRHSPSSHPTGVAVSGFSIEA